MPNTSPKRAPQNYRPRLITRGIACFEVLGLGSDRDLIRALARYLAEDSPDAASVRETVSQTIAGKSSSKGGILKALRRCPKVHFSVQRTK